MLWVVFAFLTGLAVFSILWPLAKAPRRTTRAEIDVAFYQAQLDEIEKDDDRGLIAASDAESAKAEAARRLMSAAQRPQKPEATSHNAVRVVACIALIVVPAIALGLYARIGNPDLPDQPLAARLNAAPGSMDVMTAIAKIETHLAQHPDDGRGYEVLAPAYLRLGRVEDAVRAYTEALRLLGETPERRAAYAEALVFAANGIVTAEARESFEKALAEDAASPKANLYLGLAAEQEGDNAKALDIWQKLLARSPADAPWAPALRARIAALSPPSASPGAQIAALPQAQQDRAIRGMVDGLADRLAQNGQDIEGWLRLVRAYKVLNEPVKAQQAVADARRNLGNDSAAMTRIDALARELGLEGS